MPFRATCLVPRTQMIPPTAVGGRGFAALSRRAAFPYDKILPFFNSRKPALTGIGRITIVPHATTFPTTFYGISLLTRCAPLRASKWTAVSLLRHATR